MRAWNPINLGRIEEIIGNFSMSITIKDLSSLEGWFWAFIV